MIYPDLTEVLTNYPKWDDAGKEKHLNYAERLMKLHGKVVYLQIEYHNIEDLSVDLYYEFEATTIEPALRE